MINPFTLISLDKQTHILAGISIAMFAALMVNPIAAFIIAMIIGALKEWVIDAWFLWGNFDSKDFYATCIGGAIGAVLPSIAFFIKPFLISFGIN